MRQNPKFPIFLIQTLLIFSAASSLFTGAGAEESRAGARAVVLIHDVYELQNISLDLNGSYELANDIDASMTKDWDGGNGFYPIGSIMTTNLHSYDYVFNGTLDGRGYRITGLSSHNSPTMAHYVGLFGFLGSAALMSTLPAGAILEALQAAMPGTLQIASFREQYIPY
jgi:hypothetical protein